MNNEVTKMNGVFRLFKFANLSTNNDIALVLLNYWYSFKKPNVKYLALFKNLWKKAKFTVAVDGGTNIFHNVNEETNFSLVPNLISGDFDSVNNHLLSFYQKKGSEVRKTVDQDYTDFTKCLEIVGEKYASDNQLHSIDSIVCMVGESDRFDHVMSNINTLFTSKSYFPLHVTVFLLSEDSYTCVLQPGKTKLDLNTYSHFKSPRWVSFFPVQSPAIVTTAGLQKDMKDQVLKFGSLLNTQNDLNGDNQLQVETDNSLVLLFPMTLE